MSFSSKSSDFIKYEPLPILTLTEEDENSPTNIKLVLNNIEKVLLNPRVLNSKLMIICIIGPQKSGKSFLMNFCIRYLRKKRIESLIHNQEPLEGFGWGSYCKSIKSGVYVWGETFFTDALNKTKVSVILLDCQGPFDSKLSINEIIPLQAFCTLISSVQIYNIFNQMNEINLQWIALTLDYANLFLPKWPDDADSKSRVPYQTLSFVLRDWAYSFEFFYGGAGGQQYINRFLSINQKNASLENTEMRKFVNSQYQDVTCFLMPHPGLNTSLSENFVGKWDSLSDDFQEHIHNFMKMLFSPSNVILKEIGDQLVTGGELVVIAENYYKGMISLENPKPETVFNGAAKCFHYKISNECLDFYTENMKYRFAYTKSVNSFLGYHEKCKTDSLQKFDDETKYGNNIYSERFRLKLQSQIDEEFIRFYAFQPTESTIVSSMLSVIIKAIVFLTVIGSLKMVLKYHEMKWFLEEIDTFITVSVGILLIYCMVTFKTFQKQMNVGSEMQLALRHQFLN